MKQRRNFPKMNVNQKHPFICHIMYGYTFYCKPAALSDGRIGYVSGINGSRSNGFIRKLNDLRRIMLQIHWYTHLLSPHIPSSAIARHTNKSYSASFFQPLPFYRKQIHIHSHIYKIKSIKFNSFSFQQNYNDPPQQQRKKRIYFFN